MVGTTRRQLAEIKLLDRLPAVLEEVALVRAELGYPIMVTPFSQIVVTQAVMNVVAGERYRPVRSKRARNFGCNGAGGQSQTASLSDFGPSEFGDQCSASEYSGRAAAALGTA
jgi:oxaloacetate decarboxylase alpha subunit